MPNNGSEKKLEFYDVRSKPLMVKEKPDFQPFSIMVAETHEPSSGELQRPATPFQLSPTTVLSASSSSSSPSSLGSSSSSSPSSPPTQGGEGSHYAPSFFSRMILSPRPGDDCTQFKNNNWTTGAQDHDKTEDVVNDVNKDQKKKRCCGMF